jgi:predicted ribosome quality control (RQC) complex YloA/Tae2 family protein
MSFGSLREALSRPRATVLAPGPPDAWHDRDLAPPDAVALVPIAIAAPAAVAIHPASWLEAAALFLRARTRGRLFAARARAAREEAARATRKLGRLEVHLAKDLAGLPDAASLRRAAEALLATPSVPTGAAEARVPDPYDPSLTLTVALDPRLSAPANADRLFDKARRIERARTEVERRLADTRLALAGARSREGVVAEARDVSDLEAEDVDTVPDGRRGRPPARAGREGEAGAATPGHYLTSRGLSIRVGRGARENHHLTFTVARPDDLWLHARDVPGAHVILRDVEGRAGADDLREAAEVAAFFSAAKADSAVDVHVARRKHLRPARGAPGRVVIGHAETVRVTPRDPEGRLRRR